MEDAAGTVSPGVPQEGAQGTRARLGDGLTIWLTGLPSAGKTTVAFGLAERLRLDGYPVEVLDGDEIRSVLAPELGYSRADRDLNVRRVGWVARLLSQHGVVVICALVSPYRTARDEVRAAHGGRFFEVLVAAPLGVCSDRDVKGLYARQTAGGMSGLTGQDDPYEPPVAPELVLRTHTQTAVESVETLWEALPR